MTLQAPHTKYRTVWVCLDGSGLNTKKLYTTNTVWDVFIPNHYTLLRINLILHLGFRGEPGNSESSYPIVNVSIIICKNVISDLISS